MSKFAVLKVEGLSSSDSDNENKQKTHTKAKKSTKSKKQKQQVPVPTSHCSKNKPQQQQPQPRVPAAQVTALEEWQKKDEKLVEESYQRELAQAMMASKLESSASPVFASGAGGVSGATLDHLEAESRRAANAALKREHLTEREQVRRQLEAEVQAKYQAVLDAKEAENVALRAEAEDLKRALASSEAQVAHLNSLLNVVEGKKAKGLSEQIYQLTLVISELTDNTKLLDSELAKEKTKSHQLQQQLEKMRSVH